MNFFSSLFIKPNIEILINEIPKRRNVYLRDEHHKRIKLPSFYDRENIEGKIIIFSNRSNIFHNGIKIEILGIIENKISKSENITFILLSKELTTPSKLINEINSFEYSFENVEKSYETYRGINYNIKYVIRATLLMKFNSLFI